MARPTPILGVTKKLTRRLANDADWHLARARKAIFDGRRPGAWREARRHAGDALVAVERLVELLDAAIPALDPEEVTP